MTVFRLTVTSETPAAATSTLTLFFTAEIALYRLPLVNLQGNASAAG